MIDAASARWVAALGGPDGATRDTAVRDLHTLLHGGTPVDAVAADLGATRGAVSKSMFDAWAALRRALVGAGHLPDRHETRPEGRP